MSAVSDSILKRIRAKGRGAVFTSSDFLDLGGRAAVDQTLSRLAARGGIRRLARGLYDYPAMSPRLGPLSPDLDKAAKALARQSGARLQISGARAANALGLTTQVPAKAVYLTDGPARKAVIGRRVVELKHAGPKRMAGAGSASGVVIQALRHIGPDAIDDSVIAKLRRVLSDDDKKALKRDGRHAPAWLHPTLSAVAAADMPQAA